jgi:hypothetical protein
MAIGPCIKERKKQTNKQKEVERNKEGKRKK